MVDAAEIPVMVRILQDSYQPGVLLGSVSLPEDDATIVLDEANLSVAAGIVRTGQQAQDSLARSKIGVLFLGLDSKSAMGTSDGVLDGDFAVVGANVKTIVDAGGGFVHLVGSWFRFP
jgi:hypothetical protein